MVPYKKAVLEDIIADAVENGRVSALKKMASKTVKNKKGETIRVPYLTLRREYYEKYYPEMLPRASAETKKSFWDIIDEL